MFSGWFLIIVMNIKVLSASFLQVKVGSKLSPFTHYLPKLVQRERTEATYLKHNSWRGILHELCFI